MRFFMLFILPFLFYCVFIYAFSKVYLVLKDIAFSKSNAYVGDFTEIPIILQESFLDNKQHNAHRQDYKDQVFFYGSTLLHMGTGVPNDTLPRCSLHCWALLKTTAAYHFLTPDL